MRVLTITTITGVWSVLYSMREKGDAASEDPREMPEQQVTEINDKDPLKALNSLLNTQWKDGRAVHQLVFGDNAWAAVTYKPRVAITQVENC